MKKILGVVLAFVVIGLVYYGVSPLFNNVRIDEGIPTASVAPGEEVASTTLNSTNAAPIIDTPGHPASGTARIITQGNKQFLRYEDFRTINGPLLKVYLSKDTKASDFIDLGSLRATEGNINYEIPEGVDPRDYPYALVWCETFGVLFNSAKLY